VNRNTVFIIIVAFQSFKIPVNIFQLRFKNTGKHLFTMIMCTTGPIVVQNICQGNFSKVELTFKINAAVLKGFI